MPSSAYSPTAKNAMPSVSTSPSDAPASRKSKVAGPRDRFDRTKRRRSKKTVVLSQGVYRRQMTPHHGDATDAAKMVSKMHLEVSPAVALCLLLVDELGGN